ncbi:8400_t:CDS:2 [Ambispora gerdemannii]|uniref:Transcription elongation factor SPT4 n=1 Tax=Ambispora gerdemannii TaxID=144530 RepID=A0A9N8ZB30_9GLOM|nr:8400_t:CDS:2 [Ambispora gerdemannii]
MSNVPQNMRQLRACLICCMVKNYDQFRRQGCDNCEDFLRLKGDPARIYDCTTSSFDGLMANMRPEQSWVAKYKGLHEYVKGVYAVNVTGRLSDEIADELESQGIRVISRE